MNEVGVMHVLDSLALGGAERAAVNLVNELPRDKYRPYLCTTRTEGPLCHAVLPDVGRLRLQRKRTIDTSALRRFTDFVRKENISILHAHGSSLFFSALAQRLCPAVSIVWHAHYGRVALEDRRSIAHRLALRKARAVITVNQQLAKWCVRRLAVTQSKVWCIPNMVCASAPAGEVPSLPGVSGSRIICVANLREEKDHLTLIRAMALVVRRFPKAQLLLVGAHSDPAYSASTDYFEALQREVAQHSLDGNISILGQRQDVSSLLRICDIGVLSSKTEGLPVSLLEYGAAGLPVVSTRVGECAEVLAHGAAGVLVQPQSPADLAAGLLQLLESPERRASLGEIFFRRVQELYSAHTVITQVCRVYEDVLAMNKPESSVVDRVRDRVRA